MASAATPTGALRTMPDRTLNHFSFLRFSRAHGELTSEARQEVHGALLQGLRKAAERVEIYQVFPARGDVDILVWCSRSGDEPDALASFLTAFARAANPHRRYFATTDTLFGLTRPSPYVPGKKPTGIDPLEGERQRYLTVYPFVKTAGWYAMSREARQGMMNEHIKMGREYPEVDQMLLYSFGLQDQEFVVVYEMEEVGRYLQLVNDLRSSEGRRFTERDTPITTGIYHPAEETLALWQ